LRSTHSVGVSTKSPTCKRKGKGKGKGQPPIEREGQGEGQHICSAEPSPRSPLPPLPHLLPRALRVQLTAYLERLRVQLQAVLVQQAGQAGPELPHVRHHPFGLLRRRPARARVEGQCVRALLALRVGRARVELESAGRAGGQQAVSRRSEDWKSAGMSKP
jgi:hypothetical protein